MAQIALGIGLGWLLVRHERPRAAPLLPFDLLQRPIFTLSILTSVCSFMAQMTALVALPFEIQRLGHSAVETGLFITPWPVALAITAPIAGRLADRYPAGILGGLGLLVMATGLLLLAFFPATGTSFGIWRSGGGLGFGFLVSNTGQSWRHRVSASGAAGGMLSAARLLGQTLGAAGVAIIPVYLGAGNIAVRGRGTGLVARLAVWCASGTRPPERKDDEPDPKQHPRRPAPVRRPSRSRPLPSRYAWPRTPGTRAIRSGWRSPTRRVPNGAIAPSSCVAAARCGNSCAASGLGSWTTA